MTRLVTLCFVASLAAQTPPEKPVIPPVRETVTVTASPLEPSLDHRNSETFRRTLFSRDDQVFHLLDAGINAGQHEGGGKSLEIRRFGFNLDHGGVNGGLKILVDNVQQNQGTQGHGQGYLGALKGLSPELVREVNIINGPFSAEYGDFSGLGVVHILLRDSLPDQWTARVQGGSFGSARGFLAFSPELRDGDAFIAYDGSHTDGPFLRPLDYRRDNLTGNWVRRSSPQTSFGLRFSAARNDFFSSGQVPLDEVEAGRLDRFGAIDDSSGGRVRSGTVGLYWRREGRNGAVWKADGFLSRSLFDLYSNFTFFLNDPQNGDAIQQHDSRLQQGANVQYQAPHRLAGAQSLLTAGGNWHDNQIHVGLAPLAPGAQGLSMAHSVRVSNGAGYLQDQVSLLGGRLQLGGGLRLDSFRFQVRDRQQPFPSAAQSATRVQPKASLAFTPTPRLPLTIHANYGRGISTADARAVAQYPDAARIATTDFHQVGTSHRFSRFSITTDVFWIDRSNELVYIPDDGSLLFRGPTRAYGYEAKVSVDITRRLSLNSGLTKVFNAFYRGTLPREYVDRAPHFVPNAGLTLAGWRGWSASLRLRSINHYRLDALDPTILAAGHTVVDLGVSRRIRRGLEFSFAIDNLTDRSYYETQNYFESRRRGQAPLSRIHATPGYPLTITAGLTLRFRGK